MSLIIAKPTKPTNAQDANVSQEEIDYLRNIIKNIKSGQYTRAGRFLPQYAKVHPEMKNTKEWEEIRSILKAHGISLDTAAMDADLPSAYKIETEVENEVKRLTQFYPTCGVSKSMIEVELPKDPKKENVDFVYKGAKQVVEKIASYARARIISETRKPDAVVFKLDKPIAQD